MNMYKRTHITASGILVILVKEIGKEWLHILLIKVKNHNK